MKMHKEKIVNVLLNILWEQRVIVKLVILIASNVKIKINVIFAKISGFWTKGLVKIVERTV